MPKLDFKGKLPESWHCVDCGRDTAPGCLNMAATEQAFNSNKLLGKEGVTMVFNDRSEVYTVRKKVWKAAGMKTMGGCLCIGCLEQRLGRQLQPKDFDPDHPFSTLPGTARLLKRRDASMLKLRLRRHDEGKFTKYSVPGRAPDTVETLVADGVIEYDDNSITALEPNNPRFIAYAVGVNEAARKIGKPEPFPGLDFRSPDLDRKVKKKGRTKRPKV
jgi:hypothetical protein